METRQRDVSPTQSQLARLKTDDKTQWSASTLASELVSLAGHALPRPTGLAKLLLFEKYSSERSGMAKLEASPELIDPTRLPYPRLSAPL